ncbi:MAG TPA: TolC family protein [Kofleriaceae bacterium]|nr:TolC family protein [Kofleriaceae bacterium]
MRAWSKSWIVVAALGAPAHADDPPPVRTLLTDPAQLAAWLRDHDPQTVAYRERVVAADEQAQQARVFPNPQLSAGIGGLALGHGNQFPGMPTGPTGFDATANYAVGVSELIELGKRGPRSAAADLRTREATEGAVGSLGGRLNDATTALGKLAYVAAKRDVVAQNLDAARKLEANEKIRLEHKDLGGVDFSRIQLDTEALEIELAGADADLQAALVTCAATLFVPSCTAAGLDASALDAAAPLPGALPQTDQAIEARPVHAALRLEASALAKDAVLAEHRKIPDPTLGVTYEYDSYEFGGDIPQTLGISLAIPLPFFDTGRHDAAAARANARAIGAQEQATLRSERGLVDAYVKQRDALEKKLERLEKESVPKSDFIVQKTREAFDEKIGVYGLAELLLAEQQHRELLLETLDTRFDLFNVRVNLRQSLGLDDVVARDAGAKK